MAAGRLGIDLEDALVRQLTDGIELGIPVRIVLSNADGQEIDITKDVSGIEYRRNNLEDWPVTDVPPARDERQRFQYLTTWGYIHPRKDADSHAEIRAHAELVSNLTDEQRDELEKHGRFTVVAKTGRRYRICVDGLVREIDYLENQIGLYCLSFDRALPNADKMLARMLIILADEGLFRITANELSASYPPTVWGAEAVLEQLIGG